MYCKACERPDEIDAALAVPGASKSSVARAFKIPKTNLLRHLGNHQGRKNPGPVVFALARSPAPQPADAPRVLGVPNYEQEDPNPVTSACRVCMSPDRRDIEGSIMRSVKYAAVDGAHKLDPGTTARHARRCVPSLLAFAADVAAMNSDENGEPETALQRAISAADSARRLQAAAEASNDIRARAQAAQAVSKSISTLALLNGEMGADVEAKIAMSAKWSKLKILIAAALKPFPEASKAVGMALREAEAD